MKRPSFATVVALLALFVALGGPAEAQRLIGKGKVTSGIEETAKGVGDTVVEGAKYSGNKLKASGKAAQPAAKNAWTSFKETANAFGLTVKRFFTRLFS